MGDVEEHSTDVTREVRVPGMRVERLPLGLTRGSLRQIDCHRLEARVRVVLVGGT